MNGVETDAIVRAYTQVGRAIVADTFLGENPTVAVAYAGAVIAGRGQARHNGGDPVEAVADRVARDLLASAAERELSRESRERVIAWVDRWWSVIDADAERLLAAGGPLQVDWNADLDRDDTWVIDGHRIAGQEASLADGGSIADAVVCGAAVEGTWRWNQRIGGIESWAEAARVMLLDPLVWVALQEVGIQRALYTLHAVDTRWEVLHERACQIFGLRLLWEEQAQR